MAGMRHLASRRREVWVLAGAMVATGCNGLFGIDRPGLRDHASSDGGTSGDAAPPLPSCTSSEHFCAGACVSFDDPAHCGRCDHSCLGGACTEARCQPVELARDLNSVGQLVLAPNAVFAIGNAEGPLRVFRFPRGGPVCRGNDDRCTLPAAATAFPNATGGEVPSLLASNGARLFVYVPGLGFAERTLDGPLDEQLSLRATSSSETANALVSTRSGLFAFGHDVGWIKRIGQGSAVDVALAEGEPTEGFGGAPYGDEHVVGWAAYPERGNVRPGLHRLSSSVSTACIANECIFLPGPVLGLASWRGELLVVQTEDDEHVNLSLVAAGLASCAPPGCPSPIVRRVRFLPGTIQSTLRVLFDDTNVYWLGSHQNRQAIFRTSRAAPCAGDGADCEVVATASGFASLSQDDSAIVYSADLRGSFSVFLLAK